VTGAQIYAGNIIAISHARNYNPFQKYTTFSANAVIMYFRNTNVLVEVFKGKGN
jgi:hypothetical protein